MYGNIFPQGSKPGNLYGLPKVHKTNCPIRHIISAIGTTNYVPAKFLVPILQPLASNQYKVHGSIVDEKTQLTLSRDAVMDTFDLSSLVTNIPLDGTVNISSETLFAENEEIWVDSCVFIAFQFKKLLEFGVRDDHFIFNNHLYEQVDGVAMGSLLGPSLLIYSSALLNNFSTQLSVFL